MRRLWIALSWLLFMQLPQQIVGSTSAAAPVAVPAPPTNTNPVLQLGRYVVDSLVRAKDGTVQLYSNHRRCNDIRAKQRQYRLQHPNSPKPKLNLGITYQEFMFLQQGKEDRGKLANIVFMMVFAPNFVPYAFMFFPDMLPSPFAPRSSEVPTRSLQATSSSSSSSSFNKYTDALSRQQTHIVLSTLVQLEKDAHTPPFLANLNPFGKDKVKKKLEALDNWNDKLALFLTQHSSNPSPVDTPKSIKEKKQNAQSPSSSTVHVIEDGPHKFMKQLHTYLYNKDTPHHKNHLQLVTLPKTILSALDQLLTLSTAPSLTSAQSSANTFASWLPKFITRGKVLNYIKQVEEADEFLVDSKTCLDTLNMELLQDSCQKRLMGGPDRSEQELRQALATWLDCTVVGPRKRLKKVSLIAEGKTKGQYYFNGNLARAALLSYNALQLAKDPRNASYLPRLLFQNNSLN